MAQNTLAAKPHFRAAFTLIEIIVVISIVAILASLALIVGKKVTDGGRAETTRNLIMNLETALGGFQAEKDANLSWKFTDESTQKNEFAIADARVNPTSSVYAPEPSLALLLLATKDSASVKAAIDKIDPRFIVRANFVANYNDTGPTDLSAFRVAGAVAPRDSQDNPLAGITVKDPWGNPIRYVHPKFAGGYGDFWKSSGSGFNSVTRANLNTNAKIVLRQNGANVSPEFRRSFRPYNPGSARDYGDADEGIVSGSVGYFYSPGRDSNPGSREDNVYTSSTVIKYPAETERAE